MTPRPFNVYSAFDEMTSIPSRRTVSDGEDLSGRSVRAALDRILDGPTFTAARGLSKLLRYLVDEKLSGRENQLKEYSLGVEVFGRGESFNPKTDTIVRVQARRLRAKLDEYYRGRGAFA